MIQIRKNERRPAAGVQDLLPAVVAFILIAITGSLGALILVGFQTNTSVSAYCANTLTGNLLLYGTSCAANVPGMNEIVLPQAYNALGQGITGVSTIMSYLPLIALVIVAAILIGIVLVAFSFGGNREERF